MKTPNKTCMYCRYFTKKSVNDAEGIIYRAKVCMKYRMNTKNTKSGCPDWDLKKEYK